MDHIDLALRRAREQRSRVGHTQSRNGAAARAMPSAPATYTRTKIVNLALPVLEANRVIVAQMHRPLTDVYRSLRARVFQALGEDRTSLGITSVRHGEGKTLTAVNLAIAIAMDVSRTVLLVDADLRNPGIAGCLGLKPDIGLGDYLTGQASISDCLINPGIDRLSIFPAAGRIANSAELLASPQMSQLANELRNRYPDRLIIYDLPPVLTVADTIGFLPSIEATLLVVRDGTTRAHELNRARDLLSKHNLIGTVLNAAL